MNEELSQVKKELTALASIFNEVYLINIENNSFKKIKSTDYTANFLAHFTNPQDALNGIIDKLTEDPHKDYMKNLVDMTTWEKRFEESSIFYGTFYGIYSGWNRMTFIAAKRDESGKVTEVLCCVQSLNEEMSKLNKAEKDLAKSYSEVKEQLRIVDALSRDYMNIFMINAKEATISALKSDSYIAKNFNLTSKRSYPYEALCLKYINMRVYPEDVPGITEAMKINVMLSKLEESGEYIYSYRILDRDEIHNYQFKCIKLEGGIDDGKIIVGFKNIDAIVKAAKEKEYLKILSETDSLTGLLNRGSGEKLATEALAKGTRGMLCIMDVDDFKSVNDTFGHHIGDKVLSGVADCLKNTFREDDIVFRLGGDEFAVFAKNVENDSWGKMIIQRLFTKLHALSIPEIKDRKITVSAGAIVIQSATKYTFESLYKKADAFVYVSKKVEGNEISFAKEEEQ